MRLLIATGSLGVIGGIETYLRSALPALLARGHELALLYDFPAEEGRQAIDDGCPGLPSWQLGDDGASLTEAKRWAPDVCYVHGLKDPVHEQALAELFPSAFYAHTYTGTCISGTKRFASPVESPCSRTFGKSCLALFYPRRCGGLNPLTALRLYAQQRSRAKLLLDYRAILVASRHMQEEFRKHGFAPERLHLLPYFPTDQSPDDDPPQPRELSGRIVMAGRLTNLKGGTLLVQAIAVARRLLDRPLTLVLAGTGPELPEMMALARRENVPLDYRGWVLPKERETLFRSADLLAVPSTWPEPFGIVGIEAACVGLPSVGFSVGGIQDWLLPGETGEAADGNPPTPLGLAQAIARALGDADYHQRLRQGAWRMAQRFSLASHLDRLEGLLEKVARTGAAVSA